MNVSVRSSPPLSVLPAAAVAAGLQSPTLSPVNSLMRCKSYLVVFGLTRVFLSLTNSKGRMVTSVPDGWSRRRTLVDGKRGCVLSILICCFLFSRPRAHARARQLTVDFYDQPRLSWLIVRDSTVNPPSTM